VDGAGNVIGVVVAKLNPKAAVETGGSLPENVNYAIKSSFLLSFLESAPEVSALMKEPGSRGMALEDAVATAQKAAALVLVYR
jgi:hypothetical protein